MRLLERNDYITVENYLKEYKIKKVDDTTYKKAFKELIEFFSESPYKDFLTEFYFNRYNYKYRYSSNRLMFKFLSEKLFLEEPTLYAIRKEIVYKAAMIFYKYDMLI